MKRQTRFPFLLKKKMWMILLLGFASGLPLGLTGGTLQAWYTVEGIDIVTIGCLALLGQPYVYKFLWAPFMDQIGFSWGGRRRSWMLITQIVIILTLCGMSCVAPSKSPWLLAGIALLLAFASASQDVAIDAYRTEILAVEERGLGAAMAVAGYRLAMIISGGVALILAQDLGFQMTYLLMAACMGIGVLATLYTQDAPPLSPALSLNMKAAFLEPLKEFFSRPRFLTLLALIILYKMGDAFAGALTTTFLLSGVGFSLVEVGVVNKTAGLLATILGVFIGGSLLTKISLYRALLIFGVFQAISNLGYMILALVGVNYAVMVIAIFLENVCAGMGTAAFFGLLMSLCHFRFTGAQFALFSAFSAIGRVFVGPLAGGLVKWVGWADFFLITVFIAIPGLICVLYCKEVINQEKEEKVPLPLAGEG